MLTLFAWFSFLLGRSCLRAETLSRSFIHSFSNKTYPICCVSTVLGAGDKAVNKMTIIVPLWSLEKAMALRSSTLAWKIPWMEEPGRLRSMGSLRVAYDWATSLSLFTFMHWRRKWQPTPVFLPGESQGLGSLVGCYLWGRTESDTTEVT